MIDGLEVLDVGVATPEHPVPLLFVHGAWHGAWCWAEHFLDFFADNGYRALAVSVRGHGGSALSQRLRGCSGADYVDDVRAVVATLPAPPVLIGHSMGGYLVQKYLESTPAPAGVLLAAMSARGTSEMVMRQARRNPRATLRFTFTGRSLSMYDTAERTRGILYSSATPEADVRRYQARLVDESQRAILDGWMFNVARPKRITTPLLVLAAEQDGVFSVEAQRALARRYRTEADVFPGMGHNMMLDTGWEAVARRIDDWLGARGL